MPAPFDWLLLVIVVGGLGTRAWFSMRALRRMRPVEAAGRRRGLWARAIASQWLLVCLLLAWWLARGRPLGSLGLRAPSPWGLGGVLLGLVLVGSIMAAQRGQMASRPEILERLRKRLEHVEGLMPHAHDELPGFLSLAITAGICEEILFRGFATWLLASVLPGFWLAVLGQALLFGLAHAYQGGRGIVMTAGAGAFMAGLVWVTGSLWAAMLVHALMDAYAGDMALRLYAGPRSPAAS